MPRNVPPTPRAASASYDAFVFMGEMVSWLQGLGMTIEDAERTMQRACSLAAGGAHPDEIVRYFCEIHGVREPEAWRARELAAFFAFTRKIRRIHGGRFEADAPVRTVTALVTIPAEDLEMIMPYVHRGTAAFETTE